MRNEIRDRIETARLELLHTGEYTPAQRRYARCREFNELLIQAQEYLFDEWRGSIPSIGEEVDYAELIRIFSTPTITYDVMDAEYDDTGRAYADLFDMIIRNHDLSYCA